MSDSAHIMTQLLYFTFLMMWALFMLGKYYTNATNELPNPWF